jgi:hypothetical protein
MRFGGVTADKSIATRHEHGAGCEANHARM